jgi:hypothetical protein
MNFPGRIDSMKLRKQLFAAVFAVLAVFGVAACETSPATDNEPGQIEDPALDPDAGTDTGTDAGTGTGTEPTPAP